MCIAIVKPAGKVLAEDRLKQCFENNPDGAGFAYRKNDTLIVRKGFFTFDAFLKAYRECDVNETDALVHFRITTRGDDTAMNCHPFAMSCGALIHNGTISGLGEARGSGKSDTYVLSEQLGDESFDTLKRLHPVIESHVDGTRVAVMSHDGEVLVFNRKQWVEEDGVLYSNRSYVKYESVYTGGFVGWSRERNYKTPMQSLQDEEEDEYIGSVYGYTGRELVYESVLEGLESEAPYLDSITDVSTLDEGFVWSSDELYIRLPDGRWMRDIALEDAVMDCWADDYDSYGVTADSLEIFVDLTRAFVDQDRKQQRETNLTEKAA